jgi:HSP20 family protein
MRMHSLVPRRSEKPSAPAPWGRDFDHFFDELWRGVGVGPRIVAGDFAPSVDVHETDGEYRVVAELPGLEEKDFEVSLEEDVLTIKGEKRDERENEEGGYRYAESRYGSFHRSFRLPPGVDPEAVKATYQKGLLTVVVPKPAEAKPQARQIRVSSS